MKKSVSLLLSAVFLTFSLGIVTGTEGCGPKTGPILSPSAAAGLNGGLSVLSTILRAHGASVLVLNAIADTQVAITGDVSGKSWGELTRTLLSQLYSQLPPSLLDNPAVWGALAAIEVVLATIGA